MRTAGRASWRFTHGAEQWPHAVLYVRDVLGLPVEPKPGVPPALCERVPDRSDLLEPAAREDAARRWTQWWETIVACESRQRLERGGGRPNPEQVIAYGAAANPATSDVIVGTVLAPAAESVFADAVGWSGTIQAPTRGAALDPRPSFPWELVRDTAGRVAADHAVDSGALDGAASILFVRGVWWDLVRPGFALCSLGAANDPQVAGTMLRRIFESGLEAAGVG